MKNILHWRSIVPLFQHLIKQFDGWLVVSILFLCSLGLIAMFSAGYDHGERFSQHSRNMLIAFCVFLAVAQIPPQRLLMLALPLYSTGVLLLIATELFGITKKGSTRWLDLGIVIQPSEIMKIAMPLMMAWWFHRREGALRVLDFMISGILLMIPVALILKQPDLGTGILVFASGFFVIFFAGLSWRILIPFAALGVIAIGLLIGFGDAMCTSDQPWPGLHDYQKQRICTLLDPTTDPLGRGFHIIQGTIAIGSGGLIGKGFMKGTQTHLEFIPERTTDFIFAAYGEEFGLIGVLVLLVAFLILILRCLWISAGAITLFSRLLAGSIALSIFTYVFVNIGMVSGILPVVGIPLPFISYGGTSMLTMGLSLGMVMSIARQRGFLMHRAY